MKSRGQPIEGHGATDPFHMCEMELDDVLDELEPIVKLVSGGQVAVVGWRVSDTKGAFALLLAVARKFLA